MSLSLNDRPNKVTVSGDTTTVTVGSGVQGPQGPTGATGAGGTVAYYGNFFSTETQLNAGATSKNTFTLNSTAASNGVSISATNRILFASGSAGTYDLQFSAQFDKTDSGDDEVDVWISKNGTDLEWSNTTIMLHANNGKGVAAWNWQLNDVAAGDYVQLHWSSADTAMRVLAVAAGSNPTRPAVPSLIVTVAQVTYTQAGTPGAAATVSVGSTTTGAAGTSASVTNSGTSSAAVFNFTIPRGDTGASATSPLTTKGDLYTYGTADARLAIGADNQLLTADSAATNGVSWQTPLRGGAPAPINKMLTKTGLPGRQVQWGAATSFTAGYLYFYPMIIQESITVIEYHLTVNTTVAGRTADIAMFGPVSTFANGTVATRVTNSLVSGVNVSTTGNVTVSLLPTVALTAGYYGLVIVPLGGAVSLWASAVVGDDYFGGSIQLGNNQGTRRAGTVTASGLASMPTSATISDASVQVTTCPVMVKVS